MKKRLFIALLIAIAVMFVTSCSMQALNAGETPEIPGNIDHWYQVDYLEGNPGEVSINGRNIYNENKYCSIYITGVYGLQLSTSWMEYDGNHYGVDVANPHNQVMGLEPDILLADPMRGELWIGPDCYSELHQRYIIPVVDFVLNVTIYKTKDSEPKTYKVHIHPHDPSEYVNEE